MIARASTRRGALVVGGRRHAPRLTDPLNAETGAMLIDGRAHFGRSAWSLVAKNTDAPFEVSLVRRRSMRPVVQRPDLLWLDHGRRVRPRALIVLDLAHMTAQRLGRAPRSKANPLA